MVIEMFYGQYVHWSWHTVTDQSFACLVDKMVAWEVFLVEMSVIRIPGIAKK